MNRKTIYKAAKEYADRINMIYGSKENIIEDFIAGARWRIDSVWHEASEKPGKDLVLFECRREYGKTYTVSFGENYELLNKVLIRWAYVADLLPCGKEDRP